MSWTCDPEIAACDSITSYFDCPGQSASVFLHKYWKCLIHTCKADPPWQQLWLQRPSRKLDRDPNWRVFLGRSGLCHMLGWNKTEGSDIWIQWLQSVQSKACSILNNCACDWWQLDRKVDTWAISVIIAAMTTNMHVLYDQHLAILSWIWMCMYLQALPKHALQLRMSWESGQVQGNDIV